LEDGQVSRGGHVNDGRPSVIELDWSGRLVESDREARLENTLHVNMEISAGIPVILKLD
jgi:hypothetical protein